MKIIFLDIDGVLNSHSSVYENHAQWLKDGKPTITNIYDCPTYPHPDHICCLNELMRRTAAHIVVSSAWRIGQTEAEMEELLREMGIEHWYRFCGNTPVHDDRYRENEIREWLERHAGAIDSYVVLDDDCMDLTGIAMHHVHVDGEWGLCKEDVDKAVEILNM